ncbi:MAG: hypothetical protein AAF333_13270 [Planctomycetota bacterium]
MSTRKPPRSKLTQALAFCAALLIVGTGCTTPQIEAWKAAVAEAETSADELWNIRDEIVAERARQPEGADLADFDAALEEVGEKLDLATTTIGNYRQRIADASDPLVFIAEGAKAAAPAVPGPWSLWLGLAGTALAGVAEARRRRLKNAADNVVEALEETKVDGVIDFKIGATDLRSRMTPAARELVEKARAKVNAKPVRFEALPLIEDDPAPRTAA